MTIIKLFINYDALYYAVMINYDEILSTDDELELQILFVIINTNITKLNCHFLPTIGKNIQK